MSRHTSNSEICGPFMVVYCKMCSPRETHQVLVYRSANQKSTRDTVLIHLSSIKMVQTPTEVCLKTGCKQNTEREEASERRAMMNRPT
jgi:hypothetical protein